MVCKSQLMAFINQYENVPYKVLNYLGAAINYGGRVTDDKDKRLIMAILKTFICPEAIEQGENYKYSTSGQYYVPEVTTCAEYIEYIRGLPLVSAPEAYGMHDNCNITCAQNEGESLLLGMTKLVSTGKAGGGA